jgi:hypothetical protein
MDLNTIINPLQEMAYPTEFSFDTLNSINSYAKRVEYVASHLKKVGAGSSRIVYKVDNEKVLKLAKNKKGVAQNEVESDWGIQQYNSIVAKVFETSEDGRFIEMELAYKATKKMFTALVGVSLTELSTYLSYYNYYLTREPSWAKDYHEDKKEIMQENEFVSELVDLCVNYDYNMPGDFDRISSYGLVKRNGEPTIVLIDYGFNRTVCKNHYS